MDWIDLGNPYPLSTPKHYSPIEWPGSGVVPLPAWESDSQTNAPYYKLLNRRRTRRDIGVLSQEKLGTLLGLVCHVQKKGESSLGFPLTRRPVPSGGAIHPIHLLVVFPEQEAWYRYDPFHHGLQRIQTNAKPREARLAMEAILPAPSATLILLAAEVGMTAAKYANPASIIWRDAGVLLGFLAMTAEALDLSFCPLGATGEPWVGQLLEQPSLAGVGTAFAGKTPL